MDLVDFNPTYRNINSLPQFESEITSVQIYQIYGKNKEFYIQEVGFFEKHSKMPKIIIHESDFNEYKLILFSQIYDMEMLNNQYLSLITLQLISPNNTIFRDYVYCVIPDEKQEIFITQRSEKKKYMKGKFVIFDKIDTCILKEYHICLDPLEIIDELIKMIEI